MDWEISKKYMEWYLCMDLIGEIYHSSTWRMPNVSCLQILPLVVFGVNQLLYNHLVPFEVWGTVQQSYIYASRSIFHELQIRWAIMRQFNHIAYQELITTNGRRKGCGGP